jgi:hypothetical protein
MPRLAAQQPAQRQPTATQCSMALQRFDGVVRAAGMEATARPEQWTDQVLIEMQQADQQALHCGTLITHTR